MGLILILACRPSAGWAQDNGFTEPPLVLFGKVFQFSDSTSLQLFEGELSVTLVNSINPSNAVTLTTDLKPSGTDGIFSYWLEYELTYLPVSDVLGDTLMVLPELSEYEIGEITLNGAPVFPLDGDMAILKTRFDLKMEEIELDLMVNLDVLDSDGDGMPDLWEMRYGLNPYYAGDAALDGDEDGWNNAAEFGKGSDPTSSNLTPQLLTSSIDVTLGGVSGLYLQVQDADSEDSELIFTLQSIPAGLSIGRCFGGEILGINDSFTLGSMKQGGIFIEVAASFIDAPIVFSITDNADATPTTYGDLSVMVEAFSPASLNQSAPVAWFDADQADAFNANDGKVIDLSGNDQNLYWLPDDGHDPSLGVVPYTSYPTFDFDLDDFLFWDDRELLNSDYSLFVAFYPPSSFGAATSDRMTLLNCGHFRLSLTGGDEPYRKSLQLMEDDQVAVSAPLKNAYNFFSVTSDDQLGILRNLFDGSLAYSWKQESSLPAAFPTVGAECLVTEGAASQFFSDGQIFELVLFDRVLSAEIESRVADYLLSNYLYKLWDLRALTSPVELDLSGATSSAHIIASGWGNDTLIGSPGEDVFRMGAGDDVIAGGAGEDVFQFYPASGNKIIKDFAEGEGDRLDLSPLFSRLGGTPDDYLSFSLVVDSLQPSDIVPEVMASSFLAFTATFNQSEEIWQSFTATNDFLHSVFVLYDFTKGDGYSRTLTIYEGEGIEGAILGQASATIGDSSWTVFKFDEPVSLTTGQTYSFATDKKYLKYNRANGYDGGHLSTNENYELLFKLYATDKPSTPTASTLISIDLDEDGIVEQTIKLQGVYYSQQDLKRLVGEGSVLLGGPVYPMSVSIEAEETLLVEGRISYDITIRRSGNTECEQTFYLGFSGSAGEGEDFTLSGLDGDGSVRSFTFPEGDSSITFSLTPIQDIWDEHESVTIKVYRDARITDYSADEAALTIGDAPSIKIAVLTEYAQRAGSIPGLIQITRSGDLSEALTIDLAVSGNAVMGRDIESIIPVVTFPSGSETAFIEIEPLLGVEKNGGTKVVQISVLPDPERYMLTNPWTASVLIVDGIVEGAKNFDSWLAAHFTGQEISGVVDWAMHNSDGDTASTFAEYLYGTDPTANDQIDSAVSFFTNSHGDRELRFRHASDLTDVHFNIQELDGSFAVVNSNVNDEFDLEMVLLPDGRIERRYVSVRPDNLQNSGGSQFYRVSMSRDAVPNWESDIAESLGAAGHVLLLSGDKPWTPEIDDSDAITTPSLEPMEVSSFSTFVDGSFELAFDYEVQSTSQGVIFELLVDGQSVLSAGDSSGWTSFSYAEALSGVHMIVWRVTAVESDDGAKIKNLLLSSN
ncbi:type I secretion C-terminal target domain-containing protein [Cerasicoccus frondis]|uniref:type I secretion C-terminal target domain-containing protein n=1 Tax=Cerasicoccus frondis TaxID=490090 RepID=UPI002852CEE8|nr:type I secretion C-terminal target domain-containing protein [Cerasicoccus frondis]